MTKQPLSAVVVAAGNSTRFNNPSSASAVESSSIISKPLLSWNGKPLFIHTLSALWDVLEIQELVLVIRPEDETAIHESLRAFGLNSKPVAFRTVFGGERRQDSVRFGIGALQLNPSRVLVHDAARPFLEADLLRRLDENSKKYSALVPVIPIVETIKEIDSEGRVVRTHDRNRLVRVQTPQFFWYELIASAHQQLKDSSEEFTDDAAMLEYLGHEVRTLSGSLENIKVTTPEDLRQKGIQYAE